MAEASGKSRRGESSMHTGSCLCGAVRIEVAGELPEADACHCASCRKFSGHFFVSTDVPRSRVTIQGQEQLSWFRSSQKARRGFCSICGSSLFWDAPEQGWIGIALGAFDEPTGTRIACHVHTAEKSDYYVIDDEAPQFENIPPVPD